MSVPFLQHSIQPENSKSSYTEYDNVDYLMAFEGRKLLCNSIRLEGDMRIQKGGANIAKTDDIYFDGSIGAHGLCESIQTSMQSKGVLENITAYPRMVGMTEDCTTSAPDMLNSENVCELKHPLKRLTNLTMIGETTGQAGSTVNDAMSFSFKPQFVLNTARDTEGGEPVISFTKSGAVRVVFTLARVANLLNGADVDATCTYELTNLRLKFLSVPEDGASNSTFHKVMYHIKQSVLSSRSNVSSKVPAVVDSVSCSFIKQSAEGSFTDNAYDRQVLPKLDDLAFLFNNNTNEYISYTIDSREETLMRYIDSMKDTKHNRMQLTELKGDHSYGVGLRFGESVDLSNQTFNVSLNSSDAGINDSPYSMHLYFHSSAVL